MNVDSIQKWEPLGEPDPKSLVEARLELHWAAQIPAAVGNSWSEPRSESAHLALEWLPDARAIAGDWIRASPSFRPALRVADMTLLMLGEDGSELASLALAGQRLAQGMEWLASEASAHGAREAARPMMRPDHALPEHPVESGEPFSELSEARTAELAELARWYANTERVLRGLAAQVDHASPPRLWPHHFDLAVLVELDPTESGEDARTIGVGMSPGDESYAEPYLYVTPSPFPDGARPASPSGGGIWHHEGWDGAILSGTALRANRGDREEQAGQVLSFVHSAVNAGWALVKR